MRSDVRSALRALVKTPGASLVIVATMALGIGANTAIFTIVNAVLLRAAPVEDLERLVMVWETDRNTGTTREPASLPDYLDFKARARSFEGLGALLAGNVNLTPTGGPPVRLAMLRVSHDLLPMLGLSPAAGRTFTADEDAARTPLVVMISDGLWARQYGRDPSIIGRTLVLDDAPARIVGVAPPGADFGVLQVLSSAAYGRGFAGRGLRVDVDIWAPLQPDPDALPRSTHPLFIVGKLRPGSGVAAAQAELDGVAADLERTNRENAGRGVHVEPLDAVVFGPVRPPLYLLLGAVALVLLVACVNVANLLLARASGMRRDLAVRAALGAARGRILRQAFIEMAVLTGISAAAGVGVAWAAVRALVAAAPADLPRLAGAGIDLQTLAVTVAVAVAVALAFTLIPAAQAARLDLHAALAEDATRSTAARGSRRARSVLVVAEVAFAVMLASGAGLLVRSFITLQKVDGGFRTQGVLKAEYQLPPSRYPVDFRQWPDFKAQHAFTAALLARAQALPGVESAAIAGNHPLDQGFTNSFGIPGREAEGASWPEISIRRVTPGYFETVGLGLVRGRLLAPADGTRDQPVVVINQAAARRFFADRDPLQAQMRFWGASRTIVGVVADERFHGLAADAPIAVYAPLAQAPSASGDGVLLLRTSADPASVALATTNAIRDVDPALAVFGVEPLDRTRARSLSEQRFTTMVLGLFAAVALVLAAVGVHGVLSIAVVQRRREIGIRMALGATGRDMVRMVLADGLILAGTGLVLGLAGALALTRFLASLLFGVGPTDALTFVAVPLALALVAAAACVIPARRAAAVDPLVTLRNQ